MEAGLYIVATPIGNLGDITSRALDVLRDADVIACEDTRVTNKLLSFYDIKKSMIIYNDYSGAKERHIILERIMRGEAVALVSDAGTPLISDPGYKLIDEMFDKKLYVTTIPGASSVISALTISCQPTNRFIFEGFLSTKKEARKKTIVELSSVNATLIFFERASRISKTLSDMFDVLGDRSVSVVREITKKFEEVKKGQLNELAKFYEIEGAPKGEVVIVVAPPEHIEATNEEIDEHLSKLLSEMRLKEAVQKTSEKFDISKKIIYSRALAIKDKNCIVDTNENR